MTPHPPDAESFQQISFQNKSFETDLGTSLPSFSIAHL